MESTAAFPHDWTAEILKTAPLIAPARQFIYPQQVPGEEDALARGALQLLVRPATGGTFLATCALGFTNPAMPTGIFTCPDPQEMCAVAGGYAYIVDTLHPEQCTHITLKPVTEVRSRSRKRPASLRRLSFYRGVGTAWSGMGVSPAELGGSPHHSNRRRHPARHRMESPDRQRGPLLPRSPYGPSSGWGLCSGSGNA